MEKAGWQGHSGNIHRYGQLEYQASSSSISGIDLSDVKEDEDRSLGGG
jgi:hypothetical protein